MLKHAVHFGVVSSLLFLSVAAAGCGDKGTQRVYTVEQEKQKFIEETAPERKRLDAMIKKYGPNHPQVIQMKMEMGIDNNDVPKS